MARLKKHFETLRAIRSRDFVSAEMAICKSFNDINNHNANALQDCLEKDNGLNLYYVMVHIRISNINSRGFLQMVSIAFYKKLALEKINLILYTFIEKKKLLQRSYLYIFIDL